MLGAAAFRKKHMNNLSQTLMVNFDCVGDGDYIQFFPGRRLKKDASALEQMERSFACRGKKQTEVVRGFGFYPSDNASFRRGAGVCALKHKKIIGYYMNRIHTRRDTVLEEENIALLRDGALRLAAGTKCENRS